MSKWRLLELETHDAYTNMAIDEAILTARTANKAPNTIRFYQWKPSAISIGKFQNINNEVHIENCKKTGITITRRISGGGTVYHDSKGEVTYSVITDKSELGTTDITAVYAKIYSALTEALAILGVTADFDKGNERNCPNLTVKGKKISGSAQTHKHNTVLQHGTLLSDVDLEKMFTYIRVPWAKTCMEVANIAQNKITSLSEVLGRKIKPLEVTDALKAGFEKTMNTTLQTGELSSYERGLADTLYREKYATDAWIFHGGNPSTA